MSLCLCHPPPRPLAALRYFATDQSLPVAEFARAAAERGFRYGWNGPELANHGHQAAERRMLVREHVQLMRALWRDVVAEFHGDHASLSPSWAWPKPVRPQSVPVLLGCQLSPRGCAEITAWTDGWIGFSYAAALSPL